MTSHRSWTLTVAATATAALVALSGCSTTPPANDDLQAARAAVSRARASPAAGGAASVEIDRAQQALWRAEAAWANNRDTEETRHFAYVARRRGEIAMTLAEQAQADERIRQASTERERARLQARTREATAASQAAQTAQSQAQAARQQAEMESQRAQALEQDLQSLRARATQRGMVVTLGDVLFASGRAELQPGARRTVQRIAQVLQQYPERRVRVEGFTDSQGSEALNQRLSERRAEAFRQALLQAGVASDRVEAQGRGEADPVADNGSAAGRQKNRRVEVLFSGPEGRFGDR